MSGKAITNYQRLYYRAFHAASVMARKCPVLGNRAGIRADVMDRFYRWAIMKGLV